MTESPKSDVFKTRFSTPDATLDDHRHQPDSLPRPDGAHAAARRLTRRSSAGGETSDLPAVSAPYEGTTARDFENAIVDDDSSSDAGSIAARRRASVIKRNAFMRPRLDTNKSRSGSIASSRSISPPNSVDAFAAPARRPRAGTAGTADSHAESFMALHRTRTHSVSSQQRRRTYSVDKSVHEDAASSHQGSVEDDVCFPQQEEPTDRFRIDFDDLDDFVTGRGKEPTIVSHPFADKDSITGHAKTNKVFHDMRFNGSVQSVVKPQANPRDNYPSGSETSDPKLAVDEEKLGAFGRPGPHKYNCCKLLGENFNRWSFFSSELEDTIHAPELGDLLMPGETFQHLFELGPDGGVWWLDMLMPTEEEVEVICKAFNVHGLTREDIITQETREKVELFKHYYFVCFRSFYQMDKQSEYYMEPVNVYAIVFREGIITFTFCPAPHATNVRKRMSKLRDYVSLGADWICYALIDDIVDTFQPVIRTVEQEAESIEDNIFTARPEESREVLKQIGDCRKEVMSLIRLLGGKADVIKGFAKRCNEQYSITPRQDVGLYLSDIQDHVVTMMSNLGHFEKILSRTHANYLAQISVDNIIQGNMANKTLSKVTFIATVLVPLNLVCGLFGMNVPVPGRNTDSLAWFFGIVGMLVTFVLISAVLARRLRWL